MQGKNHKGSKPCKYSYFLGSISLFLNAPCHGWQVSKQAMDGLPEKTERYSQENRIFSGTTIYIAPGLDLLGLKVSPLCRL